MRKIFFLFLFLMITLVQTFGDEMQDFYVAQKAFEDGFYKVSLRYFEDFISKYPDSELILKAKIYKAKCLIKLKDYFSAKEFLENMIKESLSNPLLDEVYYLLGRINFEGKNFTEAQNYFLKAINSKFQTDFDALSYYSLGEIKALYKSFEDALKFYRKALQLSKDKELAETIYIKIFSILYEKKDFPKLKKILKEYEKRLSDKVFKDYFMFYKAELSFCYDKDYKKAERLFLDVIKITENQDIKDLSLSRLIDIFCKESRFKEAQNLIEKIFDPELKILKRAELYFNQKRYNESLKFYEELIKKAKDKRILASAFLGKAQNLEALGRYKDAIMIFEKIINEFQDLKDITQEAHYRLGWMYLKISNFKRAIQEFKKVGLYSSDPIIKISADCQIADAYQQVGDFDKALEIYDNILKTYPNNIYSDYIQFQIGNVFLKMKEFNKAILAFKILEERFPNSIFSDEALYNQALCYYLVSDFSKAKDLIKKFIEKYPKTPLRLEVLYLLSQIYFQEKDYKRCEEILDKIIKEFSVEEELVQEAYFNKGLCKFLRGEVLKAVDYFKKIKDELPNIQKARILLWLGDYYFKEEKFNLSKKYYKEILNLPTKEYRLQALLNIGYLELERGNLKESREFFNKVLENKGDLQKRIQAELGLLEIYALLQDEKKLSELAEQLLKETKKDPLIIQRIADTLKEAGYLDKAIQFYKIYLTKEQDFKIYLSLADCYLEKKDLDQALKNYFKVVYLWPQEKEAVFKAYLNIAEIYKMKNDLKNALSIYNKIEMLGNDYKKIALEKAQEIKDILKKRRKR